jgi:hypothetical protein
MVKAQIFKSDKLLLADSYLKQTQDRNKKSKSRTTTNKNAANTIMNEFNL